jgi:hypothetical protein
MIPKTLHFCWLSGEPYPAKIQRCMNSWKKHLSGYEFVLWDRNRFDLNTSLWAKQAFEVKKYAFAADYIRFYALYHYGGIYLDADVEVLRPFDDLLSFPYFAGAETPFTIEAAVLGAEEGCDWIKMCLDYYENRSFINPDGGINIQNVPSIMRENLPKHKPVIFLREDETYANRKQDLNAAIYVLPQDFFSPKIFDSRKITLTKNTYAIHHFQSSWFSKKAFIYYKVRVLFVRIFGLENVRSFEKKVFRR